MCKNYKGQIGRKYGNGSKRAMTRKARNGGFCDTVFQNKDDPDYKPNYHSSSARIAESFGHLPSLFSQ